MNSPYDIFQQALLPTALSGQFAAAKFAGEWTITAAQAVAASANGIHAAIGLTAATQSVKTGITNPAYPRNVTIVGNADGIAGNVTIKGTNWLGAVITEILALNGQTPVVGAKAFATVTEIDLPVKTNPSGDTVAFGWGSVLGLPFLFAKNQVMAAFLNGVKETTAPTVTFDAANIEGNTVVLNSTLNGSAIAIHLLLP